MCNWLMQECKNLRQRTRYLWSVHKFVALCSFIKCSKIECASWKKLYWLGALRLGYYNQKLNIVFFMPKNFLKCVSTENKSVNTFCKDPDIFQVPINLLQYAF